MQLLFVLAIVLLLFGAKKIPELAKGLGTGMREFRQGAAGELEDDDKKEKEPESKTDKGDSDDDARSEDETSDEKASKTEQRS